MSQKSIYIASVGNKGGERNIRLSQPAWRLSQRWRALKMLAPFAAAFSSPAHAGTQVVVLSGLPVQVVPKFPETGAPNFSFPTGGSTNSGGSGGAADTGGSGGDASGSAGIAGCAPSSGGGDNGGSAYNTMMAQSWGQSAEDAANAMGVNASALAATCVMESGCQNTAAGSGSSASGAFQMINSTYTADIAGAEALDPSITASVTAGLAGKMDPGTEAYAAAYELMTDAQTLQNAGIENPTVLDTRAIYQFGATGGTQVALADPSQTLESIVNLSPAQLAANGLTASTTVGQWQQTISSKLGSTATQAVLSNNS